MNALPPALQALQGFQQFIVFKLVPKKDRPEKMDKLPVDIKTGWVSDAHNPAIWLDAQTAINTVHSWGNPYGVGFVFTVNDPFFFVDIDGCLQADGNWSPLAHELVNLFAGAAVEISQSGSGLHIIGAGRAPQHGCRNEAQGLEFYTEGRFVALTGTGATGDVWTDHTPALTQLTQQYFPPGQNEETSNPIEWTTGPVPEWSGFEDDAELIGAACDSQSIAAMFSAKCSFSGLWHADTEELSRHFPDQFGDRAYDESKADAALAAHLAFWTGKDCARIERLMWQSALARDKWTKHRTYLQRTIVGAVNNCKNVYQQKGEPAENSGPEMVSGFQYLAAQQQIEHFAGCVYIQDVHRAFTPRGTLLKPEVFKATYGGYLFAMDNANDKTTKNAWEAFTESQAVRFPKAEGMTFRPELEPGSIIKEEGRTMVNTYVPINVPRAQGDPSPFLNHLQKILPDEQDREIFLAYMAACVQHIGVKFQWAPLLQGVEGNGKTLFTRCVAAAVGWNYSHFPKPEEVGNKFNAWILRKLFIGIEDVYFPDHKREIIEALKPLITNDQIAVEFKGVDQVLAHVCANFILNSNHKDAIRKTNNDRRFCIFFTPQQTKEDLERDGMGGDYFPDLYDWLRGEGPYSGQASGYAIVTEYLATYDIPEELNPAGSCHRAPRTSTTDQAIAHGMGSVEQEILEAIEEGRAGFAGGWVSSMALDRLIEHMRLARAIPPNRRREIMQGLGYDYHPALQDGRVNNPIQFDGGKPRLFIHESHPDRDLQSPAEVAKAYTDAQTGAPQTLAEQYFGEGKENDQ